jgi:ComF family protein
MKLNGEILIGALISILERFKELVFPSNIYCICCGNIIDRTRPYSLCDACVRNLRWANKKTCSKCGKILGENYRRSLCTDCSEMEHYFEKGFTCVEYGMYEKLIIRDYKYHDKPYFGDKLAEIMYDRLVIEGLHLDMIIPVPMHKSKEKKRGYNQAALLAKGISKRMNVPFDQNLMMRSRLTKPMNKMNPQERKDNVRDAFTIREEKDKMIKDKVVLLVDDIFTTGSTLDECSKLLLEKGAVKVYMICFSAGGNRAYVNLGVG